MDPRQQIIPARRIGDALVRNTRGQAGVFED
jgi:hypothetical protein